MYFRLHKIAVTYRNKAKWTKYLLQGATNVSEKGIFETTTIAYTAFFLTPQRMMVITNANLP